MTIDKDIPEDEGIVSTAISVEELDAESAVLQADLTQEQFIDRTTQNHLDELGAIVDSVSGAEAGPQTLAVAMERMDYIASQYNIQTLGLAREGFVDMAVQKGTAMKDEVLNRAYAVSQGVLKTTVQRLDNVMERLKVNMQATFKRAKTYTADAQKLKIRAEVLKNAELKNPDARYTNQIRIAHFTRGDQTVAASGTELLSSMETSYAAFQEVSKFMEKFDKIFTFGAKNKGAADFDELAGGLQDSKFFPHQFSLSGSDALFGEEFLVSKFAGESTNINEMIAIIRGIQISHEYIWRVKELEHQELPAIDPRSMLRDIDKLQQAGQYIYEFSKSWEVMIGRYVRKASERASTPPWQNLDFYMSPGNYLLYNNLYCNIILSMGSALAKAITTNEKAVLCLLSYYKWSQDQYK